jgi:hypothetical protein
VADNGIKHTARLMAAERSHQSPEVNYIEDFENSDLPEESYSHSRPLRGFHHSQIGVNSSLLVAGGGDWLATPGSHVTAAVPPATHRSV